MRKILYLFTMLAIASCKKDDVEIQLDLAKIEKQQAPFGTSIVNTKLHKVLYNGQLIQEYFYDDWYLSGWKTYVTFDKPILAGTGTFTRENKMLTSFGIDIADEIIAEFQYVSEKMKKRNVLTFETPKTDSTRNVYEEYFVSPRTYSRKFLFNNEGYIIEEDASKATEYGYITRYIRNAQNNVSDSWRRHTSGIDEATAVQYKYDNHPNPFFKMGIDRHGELSIHMLSPNNITREAFIDSEGRAHIYTYTYEYLANWYPKRVTISKSVNGSEPKPYQLDFIYL